MFKSEAQSATTLVLLSFAHSVTSNSFKSPQFAYLDNSTAIINVRISSQVLVLLIAKLKGALNIKFWDDHLPKIQLIICFSSAYMYLVLNFSFFSFISFYFGPVQ